MRKYLALLAGLFFILTLSHKVEAQEFTTAAQHAIAVEVTTGKIIYEQDARTSASIASITKLLSVYLVYEALEKGEIQPATLVEISDYPYELTRNPLFSNVVLDERSYSVEDLLRASLITSSNSAMIALAEKIAGSEAAFVDRMRDKLAEWGITDAKIFNVSGLDNADLGDHLYPGSTADDVNQLAAIDVARIARRLILDYPQVLSITAQPSYVFGGETYYSTNQMLGERNFTREGVDGLKTGTSASAGASFVATSLQEDLRIITVVLNATDGLEHPDNRFSATNDLMNYVYENFAWTKVLSKGQTFEGQSVSIFNGQEATSRPIASRDFYLVQAKGSKQENLLRFQAEKNVFDAPLSAGEVAGHLTMTDSGKSNQGYLDTVPELEMVFPNQIHEAIWPLSWWNRFVRYVNQNL